MHVDKLFLINLIARDFVFSRLAGNGEEHKRHALALEKYQRARNEWNKQKAQKASITEELMPIA